MPPSLPNDPTFRIGKLDNGLVYYIRQNSEPENRAELRLLVNAGSVLETDGQQGLAHFLEHMCFNGTETYSGNDLIAFLQTTGTKFGADLNAYTSFDETVYMLPIRTDSAGLLNKAIDILEEWAHKVTFDPKEIDKERGVVMEEKRLRSGTYRRLASLTDPVLLADSRYPDRFPIGTEKCILQAHHDTLIRFYRDWYRPDLMAVVAIGDFGVDSVEKIIKKQFGSIPKAPASAPVRKMYEVPEHKETKAVVATDPEATNTILSMYLKRKPFVVRTLDDLRLDLTFDMISVMYNARMGELVHSENAKLLNGFLYQNNLRRTVGAHTFYAICKEDQATEAAQQMLLEYERMLRYGFTASEIARAKEEIMSRITKLYNERDKVESADRTNEVIDNYFEGASMLSIGDYKRYAEQLLPQIRPEEIQQQIIRHMSRENRVIVLTGPEKAKAGMPTAEQLVALAENVQKERIEAYKDENANLKLVETTPKAGKVVSRSFDTAADLHKWTLSNGAQVWVKSTNFKNDEIIFRAWADGGASAMTDAEARNISNSVYLVQQSGIGNLTAPQYEKVMMGKSAYAYAVVSDLNTGFRGQSTIKDLEAMMQILYQYTVQPNEDMKAAEQAKEKLAEYYRNQSINPNSVYSDTISWVMSNYSPREKPVTAEDVKKLDAKMTFDLYKRQVGRPQDFTYMFIGNIDTATFRPMVEQWIGSIPKGESLKSRDLGIRPPKGVVGKKVNKGIEEKSQVRIMLTGETTWSPEERARLSLMIDCLKDMLQKNLREDKGGTYSVGASASLMKVPYEHYQVTISFGCAPENVEKLKAAVFEEMEALKKNGPTATLLQQQKSVNKSDIEEARRSNDIWMSWLLYSLENKQPIPNPEEISKRYESVSVKDVQDAAKKYLNTKNQIVVVLYPEKS